MNLVKHPEKLISLLLAGTLTVLSSSKAFANTRYGAQSLGGSTSLSWMFQGVSIPRGGTQPIPVGYACIVRDTLGGMARIAYAHRYQIFVYPGSDHLSLQPLAGAMIRPEGAGWIVQSQDPFPEQELWSAPQVRITGGWFDDEDTVGSLDAACLNGGVTATLRMISQQHGLNLTIP